MTTAKKIYMEKHAEMLDAIFSYATEGILVSDTNGKIVMANKTVEKLFGYNSGEMIGKSIEDLVPRNLKPKHENYRKEYIADPHPRYMGTGYDLFARRKDDSEFPVEVSLSHFTTTEGKFVLSFVTDISKRKSQEAFIQKINLELEEYSKALETSNKDLEQFAYIASHDLQEPLRKILTYSNRLLAKEQENLSERGQDFLERMMQASRRMHKLITDLLEYSKLAKKPEDRKQIDLSKVLDEVLNDMEVTIEQSGAKFNIEKLPSIVADSTQMRQLFQNLISNACKFVEGDKKPEIRIYSTHTPGNTLNIYVEDQGIGFDMNYLDLAFSAFQRLEGKKYEGSGIGLAICKRIVENHGGTISAKSKPGEGATFIISLPASVN